MSCYERRREGGREEESADQVATLYFPPVILVDFTEDMAIAEEPGALEFCLQIVNGSLNRDVRVETIVTPLTATLGQLTTHATHIHHACKH